MISELHRRGRRISVLAGIALTAVAGLATGHPPSSTVRAAPAPVPLLWLDATDPASYPGSGTTWTDLSSNNRHGTLVGGVTYDAVTKSLSFPGGLNGQGGYVALNTDLDDFSSGITIEFEGEFGAQRSRWERIFDFALDLDSNAGGSANIANAFWVGQFDNFNELTIEVFQNGTGAGYCYTTTNQTALGAIGDRSFSKWVITIDSTAPYNCRIYKNGVEIPTRVSSHQLRNFDPAGANPNGSAYTLPPITSRPSTFLGRSNFAADRDLEGSIRYIRMYNETLTPSEVTQNATATVTFHANGGSGSMTSQSSSTSGTLTMNSFVRQGFQFAGWNTDSAGNGVAYTDGDTYPFSSNATLYAQWSVDPNAVTTTTVAAATTTTTVAAATTTTTVAAVASTNTPSDSDAASVRQDLPVTGTASRSLLGWTVVMLMLGTGILIGPARRAKSAVQR